MRAAQLGLLLAGAAFLAAAAPADPDWPCVQRLVPTLTAATLWPGHEPTGDWHADPALATLVRSIASSRSTEDGVRLLEQFLATRPSAEARARVFAGLVEETNAVRGHAIERLRSINRRLRVVADAASALTVELQQLPADSPTREDVAGRRAMMVREYEEVQRTIRYSCEIPVNEEARLGRFAQVLQQAPP